MTWVWWDDGVPNIRVFALGLGALLSLSLTPPLAASAASRTAQTTIKTVTVKPGQTLYRVARTYGTTPAALRAANHLKSNVIHVGQRLRVPVGRQATVRPTGSVKPRVVVRPAVRPAVKPRVTARPVVKPKVAARPNSVTRVIYAFVTVRPGQTLQKLASTYKTTDWKLRAVNKLRSDRLYAGQRLLVPRHMAVSRPPQPLGPALRLGKIKLLGTWVRVARVDLRHPGVLVTAVLPRGGFGSGARVGDLARLSGAEFVINGGYFHPRTYVPAGDLVIGGRMFSWGSLPAALSITPDNRAHIGRTSPAARSGGGATTAWAGQETVVASGPQVLRAGQVVYGVNPVFRDPAVYGRAPRSAVGLSGDRTLIFLNTATRLTATEVGKLMRAAGARDAILLDGGSSAGLAWNGRPVMESARKVAYGIGVYADYAGQRFMR